MITVFDQNPDKSRIVCFSNCLDFRHQLQAAFDFNKTKRNQIGNNNHKKKKQKKNYNYIVAFTILIDSSSWYPKSNRYDIAMIQMMDPTVTNVFDTKCENGCLWENDRSMSMISKEIQVIFVI